MSGAVSDTDVESKKEVTNLALSALESVTSIVEATEESLQQLGDSVTKELWWFAVKLLGDFASFCGDNDIRKAPRLVNAKTMNASETGVSSAAGTSILASIVTIGKSSGDALEDDGVKSVTSKLVSLISGLGQASLKSLEPGELQELNSVDETTGEGVKLAVTKESASEAS
ncbi:Thermitase, partial [Symbiodinium sp. KB8]